VVALVCVQILAPPLRSAATSCDRLDPREHHAERRAVVDVGRGGVRRAERESLPVGDDVVLAPEPPAIRRAFPGEFAPFLPAPTKSRGRQRSNRASRRPGVDRAEAREGAPIRRFTAIRAGVANTSRRFRSPSPRGARATRSPSSARTRCP
jgi:hypothetical protein